MTSTKKPITNSKKQQIFFGLWLGFGVMLNQIAHTYAYKQGESMHGFPDIRISFYSSYLVSGMIYLLGFLIIYRFYPRIRKKVIMIFPVFLLFEIFGQICGRGLIRAGFDLMIFGIVGISIFFVKQYDRKEIMQTSDAALLKLYDEVLSIFKMSVAFVTFFISVVGVSFAVQFLQKYYNSNLAGDIMVWYGVMVLFLATSMFSLWTKELYQIMVQLRHEISKREFAKVPTNQMAMEDDDLTIGE